MILAAVGRAYLPCGRFWAALASCEGACWSLPLSYGVCSIVSYKGGAGERIVHRPRETTLARGPLKPRNTKSVRKPYLFTSVRTRRVFLLMRGALSVRPLGSTPYTTYSPQIE